MPCRQTSERFGLFLRNQPEGAGTDGGYASCNVEPRVRFILSGEMAIGLFWLDEICDCAAKTN